MLNMTEANRIGVYMVIRFFQASTSAFSNVVVALEIAGFGDS